MGDKNSEDKRSDDYGGAAVLYELLIEPMVGWVKREVAEIVAERDYRRIVDIGCGTGEQLRLLQSPGRALAGADRSGAMLAAARAKLGRPACCAQADARRLPFAGGSFDLAILSFVLHERPAGEREAILGEAVRVVGSAGALLIIDYLEPRGGGGQIAGALIGMVERLAGGDHYLNYRDFVNDGGLDAAVYVGGFETVHVRDTALGAIRIFLAQPRH